MGETTLKDVMCKQGLRFTNHITGGGWSMLFIDIALSHGCVCVLLPVSCCVSSSFPQYPDL